MGVTVPQEPTGPYKTVFYRIGVADGDKIVRPPTTPEDPPAPTPINVDGEVYAGSGPPSLDVLSQLEPGDIYIDTDTGNVLRLDSK